MRPEPRIRVSALLHWRGSILLIRHEKRGREHWLLPGGGVSSGETLVDALQRELADVLGYSSIHINRAVRDLRDRGLVTWTGTEIHILDWSALCLLARFDPVYLELERRRR